MRSVVIHVRIVVVYNVVSVGSNLECSLPLAGIQYLSTSSFSNCPPRRLGSLNQRSPIHRSLPDTYFLRQFLVYHSLSMNYSRCGHTHKLLFTAIHRCFNHKKPTLQFAKVFTRERFLLYDSIIVTHLQPHVAGCD